jgi:hypothetical protein
MLPEPPPPDLHQAIRALLLAARAQVRQTVNTAIVQTYWHIGRMIVEDEQGGQKRAAYGKQVLPELAKRLSEEFGSGFSVQSLWNYRQFYQCFPILSAVRRELTWTHYKSPAYQPVPRHSYLVAGRRCPAFCQQIPSGHVHRGGIANGVDAQIDGEIMRWIAFFTDTPDMMEIRKERQDLHLEYLKTNESEILIAGGC